MNTGLKVAGAGVAVAAFAGPMLLGLAAPAPGVLAAAGKAAPPVAACTVKKQPGEVTITGADQTDYARTIAQVGAAMGVSRDGQIIAVATAIVESGLRNLSFGDRDSVGLFQQRTSQGWGTVAQIMDPTYSARKFYTALLAVPGWESRDAGEVAQSVQKSGFPGRYATRMEEAARLVGAGVAPVPVAESRPCPEPAAAAGGAGFTDRAGAAPGGGPRSLADTLAWARAEAASGNSVWYRRCLAFVAIAWGYSFSGVSYAIDHFSVVSASMRHEGDRNPPPGALLYWNTGSRAGHVALYMGSGMVASNDIITAGRISIVPASDIESRWGARYVGWTDPGVFPKGG